MPLPLGIVLSYVKQVASALQYIHDKGFIYGGVKPGNIALGEHDEVLLYDFNGIVQVPYAGAQGMAVVGTPAYMAPEQFDAKVYQASDQYALGILVYEWLGGERPFKGVSVVELQNQHMYTPPPPLSNTLPAISQAIEQVVLRALAKDPQRRFPRVQDFTAAFVQACRELQLVSRGV